MVLFVCLSCYLNVDYLFVRNVLVFNCLIMLDIVISWTYYKENVYFSSWNARQKKNCVFFYDYDEYIWYIIQSMDYSQLQRLRLNLYQKYQKLIKFTKFVENDVNGWKYEWYHLQSPIIRVDNTDFANCLDSSIRKKFYIRDDLKEKYFLKSDFINYVNLNV